jgi:hypothetical protein
MNNFNVFNLMQVQVLSFLIPCKYIRTEIRLFERPTSSYFLISSKAPIGLSYTSSGSRFLGQDISDHFRVELSLP